MIFVLYLCLVGLLIYIILKGSRIQIFEKGEPLGIKTIVAQGKAASKGVWKQVYETSSLDEARQVQARLEGEKIDCLLYEQGKKDIHGNPLQGIGVAVAGPDFLRAQDSIARMPA